MAWRARQSETGGNGSLNGWHGHRVVAQLACKLRWMKGCMLEGTKRMDRMILIQHCQSQHHVDSAKQFPDSGNGLTVLGRAQAQALGERLRRSLGGGDVRLFSSDMTRAKETANIIGTALGHRPVVRTELREWSDPLVLERRTRPKWRGRDTGGPLFDWQPFPGHESWREFHRRVSEFMTSLLQNEGGTGTPVLVLHGGTLSNIIVWWLGIPLDVLPERTCFAATPGSISVLKKNRHGHPVIEALNDRAHLAGIDEQNVAPNNGMQPTP